MDTGENARRLRRDMTDAEKAMWRILRGRQLAGLKFRRQEPIGGYIVDFVCFSPRVVIEIDGGQHNKASSYEDRRTDFLRREGFEDLRFWNNDVLQNTDGVLEEILNTAHRHPQEPPHPVPLPSGERGLCGASLAHLQRGQHLRCCACRR